ncbi:hypothetical protein B0H14DRAFT_3438240 [Mycena olivaceomarginata]|nr:hypothetical protein B0H14DRAFT_3438240 [Mycena olivaceomarginata]
MLYYNITKRFGISERAVATKNEAYKILEPIQGSHVPHFCGIIVAEIYGCLNPRHIYVVLLEYIPGIDIRRLMENVDPAGDKSCHEHKAIVDSTSRLAHDIFSFGVLLKDMAPRNVVMWIPEPPSQLTSVIEKVALGRIKSILIWNFLGQSRRTIPVTITMYRKWVIVEWRAKWFTPEAGNMLGYETSNTEYTSDDEDTSG